MPQSVRLVSKGAKALRDGSEGPAMRKPPSASEAWSRRATASMVGRLK
jgi:hypothetical protein